MENAEACSFCCWVGEAMVMVHFKSGTHCFRSSYDSPVILLMLTPGIVGANQANCMSCSERNGD